MDILAIVWGWLVSLAAQTWAWIVWLWNNLVLVAQYVVSGLNALLQAIIWVARALWRGLSALRHLNFRDIWAKIKRGYERFRWALDWYERRILGPLDRIRRQIWDVYRRFFKPILIVLDTFRRTVRLIALFDRKLAAKLDRRFYDLESKLMWPILASLRRLNELSSYTRALVTALGFLDRVTLLESLRRDALLVWEVLTNPRGRIFPPPKPTPAPTLHTLTVELELYVNTGGGPFAESTDDLTRVAQEALLEV